MAKRAKTRGHQRYSLLAPPSLCLFTLSPSSPLPGTQATYTKPQKAFSPPMTAEQHRASPRTQRRPRGSSSGRTSRTPDLARGTSSIHKIGVCNWHACPPVLDMYHPGVYHPGITLTRAAASARGPHRTRATGPGDRWPAMKQKGRATNRRPLPNPSKGGRANKGTFWRSCKARTDLR